MKILKYTAIGMCVCFTLANIALKFAVWSGLAAWLDTTAVISNGRVIGAILLMGGMCFAAGFDIARAKYEKASLKAEGRDY
jgi:hypothetical protein